MPPKALIFDLDDTLADRPAALKAYARLFADDFAGSLTRLTQAEVHAALLAADDFGSVRQAQRLSDAPIWDEPIAADALWRHWAARFGEAATPFPDVHEVLGALARRGILMGVITNGGAHAAGKDRGARYRRLYDQHRHFSRGRNGQAGSGDLPACSHASQL